MLPYVLLIGASLAGGLPPVRRPEYRRAYLLVMGLACWVFVLIGVYALLAVSVPQGIILLVIAFLLSPLGLTTAAAWLLGRVQALRYFIQDAVY